MNISYNPMDICSRSYNSFTVLYDLKGRQILQLESVSADIWESIVLNQSITLDKIVEHIVNIYDCSQEEVYDDIVDFLYDLYELGIILFDGKHINTSDEDRSIENNKTLDVEDLEIQIINDLESENQLYSATIEMTYACNEKCIHCYAHYPTADTSSTYISLQQYKHYIDELYDMGAMHIAFTGGDPFMSKSFVDLFMYSRKKGFISDIFTNGLWLYDHPSELEKILSVRPRAFYISLYGATAKTHDSITNIDGSFEKTISVVKQIHKASIPVVFNVMMLSENYKELQAIIDLANELEVEYRVGMSLTYRNDGSDSPMSHFMGDKEKIKGVLRTINNNLYSMDRPLNNIPDSEYMCGAAVTSICLSPDGTVYPCVSLKTELGNINEKSVADIWNGEKRKYIVSSLKWENTVECKNCSRKNICPHCAGMSYAETGDMFSCNTCDRIISESISEL